MATIQDIAYRVGVSKASVSLYIKDRQTSRVGVATKEKIEAAMQELNYRPNVIARSLSRRRTNIIGIMVPYNGPLYRSTFVNEALSGIQDILFRYNYSMLFLPTSGEDSPTMVRNQLDHARGYDGLIVFGTRYCSIEDLQANVDQLVSANMPFSTINMPEMAGEVNQAIMINPAATHPVKVLFDSGHRNLLLVLGRMESSDTASAIDTCNRLCLEYNIPHEALKIVNGDYERNVAKSAVLQELNRGAEFSAAWCLTDTMAMGTYEALAEKQLRVPDDISVIGTNDSFFAPHMNPPLTSLRRRIYDAGKEAAISLLETLHTGTTGRRVYLESELIMRSSTRFLTAGE